MNTLEGFEQVKWRVLTEIMLEADNQEREGEAFSLRAMISEASDTINALTRVNDLETLDSLRRRAAVRICAMAMRLAVAK